MIAIAGIIFAGFAGCKDDGESAGTITGSGKIVSENRNVAPFTEISVENAADVQIIPADETALRIEADDNIIDKVLTRVENGKLIISNEKGSYEHATVKVYASIKTLNKLECSGTANFSTAQPIKTDNLFCLIYGTATIRLEGTVNTATIEIDGTAAIRNYSLEAKNVKVAVNGTGKAEVYASEQLEASINGTGSITYAGNPGEVKQNVSGTGVITKKQS